MVDADTVERWAREHELEVEKREPVLHMLDRKDIDELKATVPDKWEVDRRVNANWDTPFAYCAFIGWLEGMKYLHSVGADVNITDHDDLTVLMYPQYKSEVVVLAVELGVSVKYRNCHMDTCLTVRQHCPWCRTYCHDCNRYGSNDDVVLTYLKEAWIRHTLWKSVVKLTKAMEILKVV
jgi:hypothetical protein